MSDPFASRYSPTEEGKWHSCWGKITVIRERIGLVLTHDEVSMLCEHVWKTQSPTEFYDHMKGLSDDKLREDVEKAKEELRRRIKKRTQEMLMEDAMRVGSMVYA